MLLSCPDLERAQLPELQAAAPGISLATLELLCVENGADSSAGAPQELLLRGEARKSQAGRYPGDATQPMSQLPVPSTPLATPAQVGTAQPFLLLLLGPLCNSPQGPTAQGLLCLRPLSQGTPLLSSDHSSIAQHALGARAWPPPLSSPACEPHTGTFLPIGMQAVSCQGGTEHPCRAEGSGPVLAIQLGLLPPSVTTTVWMVAVAQPALQ